MEEIDLLGLICGPVNTTPPATRGVEQLSPIRPADGLLPIISHPDFSSTRFYKEQKAEETGTCRARGMFCSISCVNSKLLAVSLTDELARLPKPHGPLTDGLHGLPIGRWGWGGERGSGAWEGAMFPFTKHLLTAFRPPHPCLVGPSGNRGSRF